MTDRFEDGDLVDIIVRGAEVSVYGMGQISFAVPGVDDVFTLPVIDDEGGPLSAVAVAPLPPADIRPGDLLQIRRNGTLLFATLDKAGGIYLVDPGQQMYHPTTAVRTFGPLDLVVAETPDHVRAAKFHLPEHVGPDVELPVHAAAASDRAWAAVGEAALPPAADETAVLPAVQAAPDPAPEEAVA